jgi:hypothetical protein
VPPNPPDPGEGFYSSVLHLAWVRAKVRVRVKVKAKARVR